MSASSRAVSITRVAGGGRTDADDRVAAEEPLEIQVVASKPDAAAAKSLSITMRTPGQDEDLAVGFLFTEGIITSADQVVRIDRVGQPDAASGEQNTVRVLLRDDVDVALDKLTRHFYTTSSCGVCGKASLDALHVAGQASLADVGTRFDAAVLSGLPDRVRERQRVFGETGGLHAAAVFNPDGDIVVVKEDVGRHNATDKAIGALLVAGRLPGHEFGLLVSGRASFELMQKTLVAGIPLLAAVGAPSSLAVQTAETFGMTLVGFLRDGGFNIYAGKTRIG